MDFKFQYLYFTFFVSLKELEKLVEESKIKKIRTIFSGKGTELLRNSEVYKTDFKKKYKK